MALTLKKGDPLTLLIQGVTMFAFVDIAGKVPNIVVYDPRLNIIRRVSGVSIDYIEKWHSPDKADPEAFPEALKDVYKKHSISLKKDDKVTFDLDGTLTVGVVIKGGHHVKVLFTKDGKEFTINGDAYLFTLS